MKMISTQNCIAAANIATSNLKSGTDFSIAAIMARDELSRESSEYSISKQLYIKSLSFEKLSKLNTINKQKDRNFCYKSFCRRSLNCNVSLVHVSTVILAL